MTEPTRSRPMWRRLPTGLRIFYLLALLAMALAVVLMIRGNDRWAPSSVWQSRLRIWSFSS